MGESFVVMEWLDQCLFALPMAEVERISERLGAGRADGQLGDHRRPVQHACEVTPDKQGRILLPASLRAYAGLGKTVAVIGNPQPCRDLGRRPLGRPPARPSPTSSGPPACASSTSETIPILPGKEASPMNDEQTQQAFDPVSFEHVPVLLDECLAGLAIRPDGIYLDGTAGGAAIPGPLPAGWTLRQAAA